MLASGSSQVPALEGRWLCSRPPVGSAGRPACWRESGHSSLGRVGGFGDLWAVVELTTVGWWFFAGRVRVRACVHKRAQVHPVYCASQMPRLSQMKGKALQHEGQPARPGSSPFAVV